jgi:poly-gamma-glutamate synthesis protein (capsule biosynthesis protein)
LLDKKAFDDKLSELNAIIDNREELEKQTARYYESAEKNIQNVLEPIQNRIISGLQRRHLFPSLVTRKWLLKVQDYVLCESHRDKLDYYFKSRDK